MKGIGDRVRRAVGTISAFLRLGYQGTISYPLTFVVTEIGLVAQVFIYFFLSRIVHSHAPDVGGNYLGFVAAGLLGMFVFTGGILGLGSQLDMAIQQGRLEMLLIEPVGWAVLPAAIAAWPICLNLVVGSIVMLVAVALGAPFQISGLLPALGVVFLGSLAGLALGTGTASLRVLSKRSDPVWMLYSTIVGIVAGQVVPINVLPRFLRVIAWLIPSTYVNSGLRKALMPHAGGIFGPSVGQALLLLLAFNVVVFPVSAWLFTRALNTGRRYGILAGY